jgi:hypothetical protein
MMSEHTDHEDSALPDLEPQGTGPAEGVNRRAFMTRGALPGAVNARDKETSEGGLAVSLVLC